MTGYLQSTSIRSYALFNAGGKMTSEEFTVENINTRRELDKLQGQKVDFDKDIAPLLKGNNLKGKK